MQKINVFREEQKIKKKLCAAEELAVLKTSDSAIYIDAIDGEVLPLGTHSVKIEAGEHKITLSYHKIGGSNYLLVNLIKRRKN